MFITILLIINICTYVCDLFVCAMITTMQLGYSGDPTLLALIERVAIYAGLYQTRVSCWGKILWYYYYAVVTSVTTRLIGKAVTAGFGVVLELSYVCGVFDGEGSVIASILDRGGKYRFAISLKLAVGQNTNRISMLETVKRVLGVGSCLCVI